MPFFDTPLPVTGTVHLGEANTGTVVDHANLMFCRNLDIRIPPLSAATVGPTFRSFRAMAPHIFGLTGHQHERGTGVTIDLGSSVAGPSIPLYVDHDWAEPPLTLFSRPLRRRRGRGFGTRVCTTTPPTNPSRVR